MRTRHLLVFSTEPYAYLQEEVCSLGGHDGGELEVLRFPDGERYQRITTPVGGKDVAVVGGTIDDSATLQLYDLACALVTYGAESLTLVIPYYGYSTMERATKPGEVVTAKTRARLLSAIPPAYAGNRVVLLDLHSTGTTHYFEGAISPFHVYAKAVIEGACRDLGGSDFVLACTDAGRAKWVEWLANGLGVPASFVFKRRLDGARTEVQAVSAHVEGRHVIIYDDMIRTGSSLINAARAYQAAGAKRISAIATHGVFPGESWQRIEHSGLFDKIVCTNSHPRALELSSPLLQVRSIAKVLVDALDFFRLPRPQRSTRLIRHT